MKISLLLEKRLTAQNIKTESFHSRRRFSPTQLSDLLGEQNFTNKRRCSVLQWNSDFPTQLVIASDEDASPSLTLWDVRNPLTAVKEFVGHTRGVIAMSWCPIDSSYLLTCAKDNRTICWDTTSAEIVRELPSGTNGNFDVHWYPKVPGVISASSFDGKIGLYNIEGCSRYGVGDNELVAAPLRAPKWYKRPAGASFGFGGKLVSSHPKQGRSQESGGEEADIEGGSDFPEIYVHRIVIEDSLVDRSSEFESTLNNGERVSLWNLCEKKSQESQSEDDKVTWDFLKLMFGDDGTARTKLLAHLGFSSPSDDNRDAQSQEIPSISDKEEWTLFCDTHASKLMAEGETLSATLCFIYSGDIDKTVEAWSRSLASNHDGKSFVDLLQDLMEKTIVLVLASGQKKISGSLCKLFEGYADILVSQGLTNTAMEYLKILGSDELSPVLEILRDRIALSTEAGNETNRSKHNKRKGEEEEVPQTTDYESSETQVGPAYGTDNLNRDVEESQNHNQLTPEDVLHILSLMRGLFPTLENMYRSTEVWEENGYPLFQLSFSSTHADIMIQNALPVLLVTHLDDTRINIRAREICMGILCNLSRHNVQIINTPDLIMTTMDHLSVNDVECLAIVLRLITFAVKSTECEKWLEALQSKSILRRLLHLFQNALDVDVCPESSRLLLAIIESPQATQVFYLLVELDLPEFVTTVLSNEMDMLMFQRISERFSFLENVFAMFLALSSTLDCSMNLHLSRLVLQLSCKLIRFEGKSEVASCCFMAMHLLVNIMCDASELKSYLPSDIPFVQDVFDVSAFEREEISNGHLCFVLTEVLHQVKKQGITLERASQLATLLVRNTTNIKDILRVNQTRKTQFVMCILDFRKLWINSRKQLNLARGQLDSDLDILFDLCDRFLLLRADLDMGKIVGTL